jgi:hypothetical protein
MFSHVPLDGMGQERLRREIYPPSILIPAHDVIVKTALPFRHDRRVPPIDHPMGRG